MHFSFTDRAGHRRLHVALQASRTLTVGASISDAAGRIAIRTGLADAAATFALP